MRWMALAMVLLGASPARADDEGDGLYDRWDTDLTLGASAGGGVVLRDGDVHGTALFDLRALVLDAAGLILSARVVGGEHVMAGVELHPLFPLLFFYNGWTGRERLDLFVQSLFLELGVAVTPLGRGAGAALAVGTGVEVPIVPPTGWAHGLSLRLVARHVRARAGWQSGPEGGISEWTFAAALSFKIGVDTGFVAREPPRFRP